MSLLDFDEHYKAPYKRPKPYQPGVGDNMAEMNNLGRKKVAEDFSDRPINQSFLFMKEEPINPTRQHSMKCPKLHGEGCTCDGYHTFDELYDHRITLFIALCRVLKDASNLDIWRSKRHSDGELCFGTGTQFVLGIWKEAGEQITYHIPIERWNEADFAETLEKGPEWDGHTSDDVLTRLAAI